MTIKARISQVPANSTCLLWRRIIMNAKPTERHKRLTTLLPNNAQYTIFQEAARISLGEDVVRWWSESKIYSKKFVIRLLHFIVTTWLITIRINKKKYYSNNIIMGNTINVMIKNVSGKRPRGRPRQRRSDSGRNRVD